MFWPKAEACFGPFWPVKTNGSRSSVPVVSFVLTKTRRRPGRHPRRQRQGGHRVRLGRQDVISGTCSAGRDRRRSGRGAAAFGSAAVGTATRQHRLISTSTILSWMSSIHQHRFPHFRCDRNYCILQSTISKCRATAGISSPMGFGISHVALTEPSFWQRGPGVSVQKQHCYACWKDRWWKLGNVHLVGPRFWAMQQQMAEWKVVLPFQ